MATLSKSPDHAPVERYFHPPSQTMNTIITKYPVMTPENQSSRQLEDNKNLKKEIEKLNKVIELQQKTIEHDKKFMI